MHEILKNVLEHGYHKLFEPTGLELIDINKFKLLHVEERGRDNGVDDVPLDLSNRLNLFAQYLKEKYINPLWPNSVYNKFIVWEGTDKDNEGWHTDLFEGYDIFMLYYFDDTKESTGGAIQFKWKDDQVSYQPKAGDLFIVNNCRGFWHRATSTTITRRVASFDFNVGLYNND
jgi:hypothetical protein